MLYFLFFMLGLFFTAYIMPLLDSLFSVILTKIEITKGKHSLEITKINIEGEKIASELDKEGQLQPVIGFQYEDPEEEDFDDL